MTIKEGAKKRINIFDACDQAAQALLEAGFEFRYQSRITESRYYGWPGRPHTIRVAAHKSKHGPLGMPETVAKITFHEGGCETRHHIAITNEAFLHTIALAIGMYMIKSTKPMKSRYTGIKHITWASGHGAATVKA